ncbi:ATP-dependent Clp protease proteolytic subunit [Arsenophonus nasoniae]|uniref:ATP-dependent Clp protease proteolytic subunit n=1 Tax=Arsenophonus nasoniae TaxID=638 RepID=UPI003878F6A9
MIHTIHFLCPVMPNTVNQLQERCFSAIANGATQINLHMSSSGGDITSGFTGYNFLKTLPIPVTTFNISNIDSIANVIFLAGSERNANNRARFLLHPFQWGLGGIQTVDHERMREWVSSLDHDLERFIDIFKSEVGDHDWREMIKSSKIINPADALSYGIINHINDALVPNPNGTPTIWWVTG